MPDLYFLLLLIIIFSYFLFTLGLFFLWVKIPYKRSEGIVPAARVTVIVPVRNEAETIGLLLKDLNRQTYPPSLFEVLVVNDASTDNTAYVLDQFQAHSKISLKVLTPQEGTLAAAPKKRAILTAIGQAQGELIITTDGDCRVGAEWLTSIVEYYQSTQAKFISGPVTFSDAGTLMGHLQLVEFSSLVGSGAACVAAGRPSMCNGANLAYEKKMFYEVGGFAGNDQIASGDDEFLMHKIARAYPGQVHFLKDRRAIVQTAAHTRWSDFYQQRKRWGSKWKHYQSRNLKILAFYIFLCNAALASALILKLFHIFSWSQLAILLLLKWLPEWLFIGSILLFLKKKSSVPFIPIVQLLYPFYVLIFGLMSQKSSYVWKGRTLK